MKSPWFIKAKNCDNAQMQLFCFPYAGGNASTYLNWSAHLPDEIELIAVQPPGRANRVFEPAYTQMSDLIAELNREIMPLINKPFIFFGHSLGSRVAFELIRTFKKQGKPLPEHFIASGSKAPHDMLDRKVSYNLPDSEFTKTLATLEGTPKIILQNEELMELCLPLLRADFELSETYKLPPQEIESFDINTSVLGGVNDPDVSVESLEKWQELFTPPVKIHTFEGGHFFIDECKKDVLTIVNDILHKVKDKDLIMGYL